MFFKSSSTWSSRLNIGLPTGLDEHGSHSVNFLTVLVVSILIACPAQRNLCDFINLTIFFYLIRLGLKDVSVNKVESFFMKNLRFFQVIKFLLGQ